MKRAGILAACTQKTGVTSIELPKIVRTAQNTPYVGK